ncbi:copper uptake system-associated protein [Undibacterium cyanobacteriorum]|uniref:Copper uptake system-associated protein n=1 Tax=Undibacterium cyanobacteriorum TaxID=3073561 RepID=A0ABY9RL28_9BURK|nr:copper uptake system-associated protein [Undibacterium sp. 20NA77.5]WMW81902.1 copper uptake system-associated protein [Undibacterium sp. 20NA77.5]
MFKIICTLMLIAASCSLSAQQLNPEQKAIQSLIASTYDQANSKVQTSPIVTVADYAIADWIQGEKGGRALLKKTNGNWEITMCGGQGLTVAKNLIEIGIPTAQAHELANALKAAETQLDQQKIKLFDSFGKTISLKEMQGNHHADRANKNEKTEKHPHHP